MSDLISRADAIRIASGYCHPANIAKELAKLPSAQPEIIRCKECKYYEIAWLKKDGTDNKRYKPSICVRGQYGITRNPDWYCADAERKGEQNG